MLRILFILLIAIPLVELYVLIEVGSGIGGVWTILLCLLTAGVGLALVRHQGLRTIQQAQKMIAQGQSPAGHMLHGMMLALAGLLLLIPGFVTDSIGFLLLLPPFRHLFVRLLPQRTAKSTSQQKDSTIIDVEIIDQDRHHLP